MLKKLMFRAGPNLRFRYCHSKVGCETNRSPFLGASSSSRFCSCFVCIEMERQGPLPFSTYFIACLFTRLLKCTVCVILGRGMNPYDVSAFCCVNLKKILLIGPSINDVCTEGVELTQLHTVLLEWVWQWQEIGDLWTWFMFGTSSYSFFSFFLSGVPHSIEYLRQCFLDRVRSIPPYRRASIPCTHQPALTREPLRANRSYSSQQR